MNIRFSKPVMDYLKSILTPEQIAGLKEAIASGKTIIIKGEPGPTGKSTLKRILNKNGAKAIEGYETFEIMLDKVIESPVANFADTILSK